MSKKSHKKIYISIDDIVEYINCPLYYKMRNIKLELPGYISSNEMYHNVMCKSLYDYFTCIRDEHKVSVRTLINSFVTVWVGRNQTLNDVLYSKPLYWRDIHNEKRKKALKILNKIHNLFKKEKCFPALVNYKYEIEITSNITLIGTIDLVKEVNNCNQLLVFKTDFRTNNHIQVAKDLHTTASVLAFQCMFNKLPDKIIYFDIEKCRLIETDRNCDDFTTLKALVLNVTKSIHNNLYYANVNDKCYNCMLKNECIYKFNELITTNQ